MQNQRNAQTLKEWMHQEPEDKPDLHTALSRQSISCPPIYHLSLYLPTYPPTFLTEPAGQPATHPNLSLLNDLSTTLPTYLPHLPLGPPIHPLTHTQFTPLLPSVTYLPTYLLLLLSNFSPVRLCVTPQMAVRQAPLFTGFSRQEYWSGLPFPSPPTYLPISL